MNPPDDHDPDFPDVDPATGDEAETLEIERLTAELARRDRVIDRLQRAAHLEAQLRRRRER